ncbi:Phenylalanyl-tRNA synthetase alpha chain [Streptococcus sp. HSISS2]|nr:Phenylalanyl-tRNA synthetase alpha chain [Streptococcus sp. HSISS2]
MDLQTQLQELKTSTQAKLAEMRGEHSKELQELRVAVLGKKGSLTDLLKGLKDLPNEERPKVGKMVNEVRDVFTEAFDEAAKIVEAAKIQAQLDSESLDVTLPGRQVKLGNRHILSQTAEEIEDIFLGMGFQIVDGFEVETDYYNFERMNLPKDHQRVICKIPSTLLKKFCFVLTQVLSKLVHLINTIFLKVHLR